jgi:exopolysaccharide biosynthesis WecB/TagA/CpsF family protein
MDKEYADILKNKTDLLLGDGIGVNLLTRMLGQKMKENLNGSDFSPQFMRFMAHKKKSVYLLGGEEGVAKKAGYRFARDTGIQVAGYSSGFFDNDEEIIRKINQSGADILFVALGVPKQEKWIVQNRSKLLPQICLGVGALFDYNAGRIKRSPRVFRNIHMEWLWRVFMEPNRLFKRYFLRDLPLFVKLIVSGNLRELF